MILLVLYLAGLAGVLVLLAYALRCHLDAEEFETIAAHREQMAALDPTGRHGR